VLFSANPTVQELYDMFKEPNGTDWGCDHGDCQRSTALDRAGGDGSRVTRASIATLLAAAPSLRE
jgi:hypothetical protein